MSEESVHWHGNVRCHVLFPSDQNKWCPACRREKLGDAPVGMSAGAGELLELRPGRDDCRALRRLRAGDAPGGAYPVSAEEFGVDWAAVTGPAHGQRLECCQDVRDRSEEELRSSDCDPCGFFWLEHSTERSDTPRQPPSFAPGWHYRSSFQGGFLDVELGPLRFCPFCGKELAAVVAHRLRGG